MDEFFKKTSYPDVLNLTIVEVNLLLSEILTDKKLPMLQRTDARKMMAVLRNLLREMPNPPLIIVLTSFSGFSLGRQIFDKIIFYTGQRDFYKPIQKGEPMDIDRLPMNIDRNLCQNSNFSPRIVRLAKQKGKFTKEGRFNNSIGAGRLLI